MVYSQFHNTFPIIDPPTQPLISLAAFRYSAITLTQRDNTMLDILYPDYTIDWIHEICCECIQPAPLYGTYDGVYFSDSLSTWARPHPRILPHTAKSKLSFTYLRLYAHLSAS